MPRLPRVYIEDTLYYVTSKAGHGQSIFREPSDYKEYISLIAKYKKQYGFKLFAYVLLPTHLHMLIEVKNDVGISNIMHDINSLYTKMYNSKYNKKGHLFQERFKAALAEKESYLLLLTRHIHLNPKKLAVVNDPKDYAYSSYNQFMDPAKRQHPDIKSEIEEVFGLIKGREELFEKYVRDAETKDMNELTKNLHKKRILGSKAFTKEVKKTIEETAKRQKKAPFPKKVLRLYILFGGILILIATTTVAYFYKRSTMLETEYDKTVSLYKKTLEMLERERKVALSTKKDAEEYLWKIRLTEKALGDVEEKRLQALEAKKELEGYAWRIELRQIGGLRSSFSKSDTIFFKQNRVNSTNFNLKQESFPGSTYSKRELENGNVVWETIQKSERGETMSWRGEWNGKVMKGVLSRRSSDGTSPRDFSFVSVGEREKR